MNFLTKSHQTNHYNLLDFYPWETVLRDPISYRKYPFIQKKTII